jgi:epoxyqueuosine reductase QueG
MKATSKHGLTQALRTYVAAYADANRTETRWGTPLVGFADAADPLFAELKRVAAHDHALPSDLLSGARSVVSFFIPFQRDVALSNVEGRDASREWAVAYVETNKLIGEAGAHVKRLMEADGRERATAPPATHNFDRQRLVSTWSHRHAAYIAGLGRFGLNNMLITSSGCCGRYGSLVTTCTFEPDAREDGEACLYRHDGSCARCASRCVGDALSTERFDRHACHRMLNWHEATDGPAAEADVCGKCLVGVPCSFTDPVRTSRP